MIAADVPSAFRPISDGQEGREQRGSLEDIIL